MLIDPINEYVTVKPIEADKKSAGGLHLVKSNAKFLQGVILRIGRGMITQSGSFVEPQVKPGDTVLFRAGRGTEETFGGDKVLFLTERDFVAVIRDGEQSNLED